MSKAADNSLPPWLLPLWQQAVTDFRRLPHAILLAAPAGSGKRLFAEKLAQRLLCTVASGAEFACGECPSCNWFAAANHPDMLRLVPASAALEEADASDDEPASDRKEKKASDQILIDQVRDMQGTLEISGHQGGRRMVLIDPAEAMNIPTANALLKSLEEPATDAVFILVSHHPRRLLPTIRSRCQAWNIPRPDAARAKAWLAAQKVKGADELLGFASGLPLSALALAGSALGDARGRFARDMNGLMQGDALKLAGEWEAWLKSKAAGEMGLNLTVLVSWLQRWLYDGARLAAGSDARFFADQEAALRAHAQGRSEAWISCYNELAEYRRVAQHPLNARLFLEDMLLRITRTLNR